MVPRQFLYETGKDGCICSGLFWHSVSERARRVALFEELLGWPLLRVFYFLFFLF